MPVEFVSVKKIKAAEQKMRIPVVVREALLATGAEADKQTVLCLISSYDAYLTICRDLDRAVEQGWFKKKIFKNDDNTITIMYMMDGGGGTEKFVFRLQNVEFGCSARHCSIVSQAEAKDPKKNSKPGETYDNVSQMLEKIDYRFDLEENAVVEVLGKHVLVPARACPLVGVEWQWVGVDDSNDFDSLDQTKSRLPPEKRLAQRRDVVENSAVFVVCGSVCLGILCQLPDGNRVTFPFRERPMVSLTALPQVRVHGLRATMSSDLMATAVLLGCPNQGGCACLICRVDARKHKLNARNGTANEPRTEASNATDLDAYNKQSAPAKGKKKPVHPISRKSLVNVKPHNVVAGPLHLLLGLGNDDVGHIRNRARELDGTDMLSAMERDALCVNVENAECQLALVFKEVRLLLGDANDVLKQRIPVGEDPGKFIETVDLDDWAPVVHALTASRAMTSTGVRLASAVSAVGKVRREVDTHDALHAVDTARVSLVDIILSALHAHGIRPSRYWLVCDAGTSETHVC